MRTSLACGGLGYVLGGAVAAALVVVLHIAVGATGPGLTVDIRGGDAVFKIAWSAAVFGIGPLVAVVTTLALGRRQLPKEALVPAVVLALFMYGLTVWVLAPILSAGNDCRVGVKWPDTSVPGCD